MQENRHAVRSPNVLGQRVRGARLDVEHDMHQEAAEGAQAERHREPRRQGGALYGGMRTRALGLRRRYFRQGWHA
jgi:hypothetical protein